MNSSTLPVERPSTQYAISLMIPWRALQAQSSAMCQNAEPRRPVHANAPLAPFLDVPTLTWVFRQIPSFGCSKEVYKIDRGSRFVSLLASYISVSFQSVSAIGPAHDASHFCILSHLFRPTPPPGFPLIPPRPDHTDRLPLWQGLSRVHKAPHSCPLRMVTHQAKPAMVHRVYGWVLCDS